LPTVSSSRRWILATAVAVAAGGGLIAPFLSLSGETVAHAADANAPTPKLVVHGDEVSCDADKSGFMDTLATPHVARCTLVVTNEGDAGARSIEIRGYYADGKAVTFADEISGVVFSAPSVAARTQRVVRLSFSWSDANRATGWLILNDALREAPPVVVPFVVRQIVSGSVFVRVLLTALVIAVLLCFSVHEALKRKAARGDPPSRLRWRDSIRAGDPKWSFKDSWASNITALGAVLGTVLAASGLLNDVLPGLSTGLFVGFSLLYGFLALMAPIVFTALSGRGTGTYIGLLVSAGITVWAVLGEVGTLAQMLHRGGVSLWWGWSVTVVSIAVISAYVWASLQQLVLPSPAISPRTATLL
jgi:hypothetical protein